MTTRRTSPGRSPSRILTEVAQAQFREAIEALSEGFALYGPDDRLIVCNRRYVELYDGLDVEVAPGLQFTDLMRAVARSGLIAEANENVDQWVEQRLKRHQDPQAPFEQPRADGRWLKISERRTKDGGIVGVYTDITELKVRENQLGEMVDRLAEARDQAMAATRTQNQFLANMSHELRTPLNAVIGLTEMVLEDAEDDGLEDYVEPLQRVLGAGKHLLSLINHVLDLARMEAGRMEVQLERFALPALVREIESAVQPLAKKGGNELAVSLDTAVAEMYSDVSRVRQIVTNLLRNAMTFTEHGRVELRVRDTDDGSGQKIEFCVADTGIGMSDAQLSKLFQAFTQGDASSTRKYGGTGLGLAISRKLALMLGGDIVVKSTPGVGTTFRLLLPVAAATEQLAHGAVVDEQLAGLRPKPQSLPRTDTILVIDDDPTVLRIMERCINEAGYRVITVDNGRDGLKLAREQNPAVICLDIIMPNMDGWDVLRELKSGKATAAIPVVLVTILDEQRRGYSLGASDYISKPVDRDRLTTVIGRYCRPETSGTVLLIEDDEGTRHLLRRMLVAEGWQVQEAENGRVGLERLGVQIPDVILLDLMMPEMNGFDFLFALRTNEHWRDIPVVVVTAATLTAEDHDRLNLGVQAILNKGACDREDLLKRLQVTLGRLLQHGDSDD